MGAPSGIGGGFALRSLPLRRDVDDAGVEMSGKVGETVSRAANEGGKSPEPKGCCDWDLEETRRTGLSKCEEELGG
jgi:hypothetical protein